VKVNHHQVKNAIAHISKSLEKQFPHKKLALDYAFFADTAWRFVIDEPRPMLQPDGSIIYDIFPEERPPSYIAKLAEIGTDESISLNGLFIHAVGLGVAVDNAWGFLSHADKIATASLSGVMVASSYRKNFIGWELRYSGLDKENEEIEIDLYISKEGLIIDIKLNYPRTEKANKLADDFTKHSGEILNPEKVHQEYYGGNTGIHTMWYKGFNLHNEAIKLILKVDANKELILSHEIKVQNLDSK
jgi:hypothetical protein